ncbi:MAG: hypothetical protein AAGD33_05375 [Actinomycetota bacterium]
MSEAAAVCAFIALSLVLFLAVIALGCLPWWLPRHRERGLRSSGGVVDTSVYVRMALRWKQILGSAVVLACLAALLALLD